MNGEGGIDARVAGVMDLARGRGRPSGVIDMARVRGRPAGVMDLVGGIDISRWEM